jgi:hypothetical protein
LCNTLTSELAVGAIDSIQVLDYIRILTASEMTASRQIFGWTFAIGTRNNAPSRAARNAANRAIFTPLRRSDTIRLVVCPATSEVDRPGVFKAKVDNKGCDFTFDEETAVLTLRLRFIPTTGGSPDVSPLVHFPEEGNHSLLTVGRYLVDSANQTVYKIVSIAEDGSVLVKNLTTQQEVTMRSSRALQLARAAN